MTDRLRAAAQQQMLLNQEREMVAKLTEVDRVKSDFVSTMSHELRTPLTSIIGYTELLEDEGVGDEGHQRMIGAVAKNAQRLLLLVEDLLTLSQVESAQAAIDTEDCDVTAILRAVDVATAPLATTHDVRIELRVQESLPVRGNAVELERVFLNLVTNAIKFSDRGSSVMVWARVSGGGDRVVVRVTDRGIGIAEDELPQLFTRFFRSRKAQENVIPGTGLGLSIVASIIERHRGAVEIDSVENEGTTVTVTLPAHPGMASPEPPRHRLVETTP